MTGAWSVREKLICPLSPHKQSPVFSSSHLPQLSIVLFCSSITGNESQRSEVTFIYSHRFDMVQVGRSRLWRVVAGCLGCPGVVWGPELGVGHAIPDLRPGVAPGERVAQCVRSWEFTIVRNVLIKCLMCLPLVLWTTIFLLVSRSLSFWGLSLARTEARKFM